LRSTKRERQIKRDKREKKASGEKGRKKEVERERKERERERERTSHFQLSLSYFFPFKPFLQRYNKSMFFVNIVFGFRTLTSPFA
jgi:hypothetical protein